MDNVKIGHDDTLLKVQNRLESFAAIMPQSAKRELLKTERPEEIDLLSMAVAEATDENQTRSLLKAARKTKHRWLQKFPKPSQEHGKTAGPTARLPTSSITNQRV